MNVIQKKCIDFFKNLSFETLNEVDKFYAKDASFTDPLIEISGIEAIRDYYRKLYQHVTEIDFEFNNFVISEQTCSFEWIMDFKAKKLNSGKNIRVFGISCIKFNSDNMAIYQRDYYDMGEFIYERVPILASVIKYVKRRLKS